ncbi:MAG: cyclic 2,3-diphosphoglycerate synthase [Negativicutes bacterium]|nr:cyclic 2,3-diphosphoglycerate synthase [Negativicutes bacterium]
MNKTRVLIMGAAGRDFHVFNTCFRDNNQYEVVCFTATQIPDIAGRRYPAELSGRNYPEGIEIFDEADLVALIRDRQIDEVVFAYSDVSHDYVMHHASTVLAAGADFRLIGPKATMIKSSKPVVSIGAVRTGAGKSQTTRAVCKALQDMGFKVVAIRHPMPYGDLVAQECMRFASYEDLDRHNCTIEEREEFEPHIDKGIVVYCGVDYETIIREAEREADIIVWDGGNNDFPFYKTDLHIVVADPHRPGHELTWHPGETNLKMADVIIINKIDSADRAAIDEVRSNIARVNPEAVVIDGASPVTVNHPEKIRGKRVLVIEDGPTLTHGSMAYGAGVVAARKFGAAEIVNAKQYAVGSIADTYAKYQQVSDVLPAMGYGEEQIRDMEDTIRRADRDIDAIVSATPIDITRVMRVDCPIVRVGYDLQEIGFPTVARVLATRFGK